MQSPGAAFARAIDFSATIAEIRDEEVLICVVAQTESQVMREGGEINLEVDRKWLVELGHGVERFAFPTRTGTEHRKNHVAIFSHTEFPNKAAEFSVRRIIEVMSVTRSIHASQVISEHIGLFGPHALHLSHI